jgi:hypothetical protein
MKYEMNEWEKKTNSLIQTHLAAAVPLLIIEILAQGGLTDFHLARAREHGQYIAEHGDAVMFYQKGLSAEAMTRLTEGIAVLSFAPGGVEIFGLKFDASEYARRLGYGQTMQEEEQFGGDGR